MQIDAVFLYVFFPISIRVCMSLSLLMFGMIIYVYSYLF